MTQQEKIVMAMLRHPEKQWWYPPDFMQPAMSFDHPSFVGYEASARLSELAKEYPDLVESRRRGKYIERRMRIESLEQQADKIGGSLGKFLMENFVPF